MCRAAHLPSGLASSPPGPSTTQGSSARLLPPVTCIWDGEWALLVCVSVCKVCVHSSHLHAPNPRVAKQEPSRESYFLCSNISERDVRFSLLSDLGPVLLPSQETDHSPSHFCVQHDDVFGAPVLAGRASPDEGQHSVMGGLGS